MTKLRKWQRLVLDAAAQDYCVGSWVRRQGQSWPKAWATTPEVANLARLTYWLADTNGHTSLSRLAEVTAQLLEQEVVAKSSWDLGSAWKRVREDPCPSQALAVRNLSFADPWERRAPCRIYWQFLADRGGLSGLIAIYNQLQNSSLQEAAATRFRALVPLPPLRLP
jgi:hypothetical protein